MPSTTNFSWTTPADTDYVKDGASAIRTLANGIDTSMAQLKGGTTGQILSKTNGTDMAFTWINNDQGDLTAITAGTGISVTNGTGPIPTVAIDTATTVDLSTAQTLTNKKLSDSTTSIVDVTDTTKGIKFDVTGTTGITGTITTAFTTAKTLTLPDATDTLVGKATTDTLTNKTISASSNTLTGVINNTLTSSTGDLIYASSANTPARLAIGSTNQVLTVSGGVPTWANASSSSFPTFRAYKNADQTISANTNTKVTWTTENWDSDNCFASDKFTPNKAGKYLLTVNLRMSKTSAGQSIYGPAIKKNGNDYSTMVGTTSAATLQWFNGSCVVDANGTTDYFEVYIYMDGGAGGTVYGNATDGSAQSFFSAVGVAS